jgi:acetoin utilization deacetylase AcuC-like enzyme
VYHLFCRRVNSHESDTKQLVAVPLPAGTDSTIFREKIEEHWMPALEAFRPQLFLVSAGFDAHVLDGMSGLALRETDFAWITAQVMSVASDHADGRVVSVLEGGYHLGALGRSVATHLKALLT